MALSKSDFKKLSLEKRYHLLQKEGVFIASRQSESYFVHLFALEGEYIEMWKDASLNYVMWIEILTNKETLKLYSEQFDPKKDLGL